MAQLGGDTGGMSSRAIATVLGVSHTTVCRDTRNLNLAPHLIRGLDGKRYRSKPLDDHTRHYLVSRCHNESHHNGLSVRKIVAVLAEDGWRISVGTVATYLKQWRCEQCSSGPNGAPEQQIVGGS